MIIERSKMEVTGDFDQSGFGGEKPHWSGIRTEWEEGNLRQ